MKLHGSIIDKPDNEIVVIPRKKKDLIFEASAVLDFTDFDKLCPIPKPPTILKPGGIKVKNVEDPEYNKKLNEWAEKKDAWIYITSLRTTSGLEWETVKYDDPETWSNYSDEMDKIFTNNEKDIILEIGRASCRERV